MKQRIAAIGSFGDGGNFSFYSLFNSFRDDAKKEEPRQLIKEATQFANGSREIYNRAKNTVN